MSVPSIQQGVVASLLSAAAPDYEQRAGQQCYCTGPGSWAKLRHGNRQSESCRTNDEQYQSDQFHCISTFRTVSPFERDW
jgi:hypothetical protein